MRTIKFRIAVLLFIGFLNFVNLISQDSSYMRRIRFHTYIGSSKSNYFYSRIPSFYSDFKKGIDNTRPMFSIGSEAIIKIKKKILLGVGLSYNQVKIQLYYSNFVNPNLLDGYISSQLKHQYVTMPLNVYWKVPISSLSSLYLFSGLESLKTINFKKAKLDYVSVVRSNGVKDNASIGNDFKVENFSLFSVFNIGLKAEFNQFEKNRVTLGLNYYLMNSQFAVQNSYFIFAGNKNYESTDILNFEGLRFTLGYIW